MIKVEVVIEDFTFARFDEIKDTLVRKRPNKDEYGKLYLGDTFECDKDMCEYLAGKNPIKKVAVRIVEVVPEKKAEIIVDVPVHEVEGKIEYKEEPVVLKATFKKTTKKKNKK